MIHHHWLPYNRGPVTLSRGTAVVNDRELKVRTNHDTPNVYVELERGQALCYLSEEESAVWEATDERWHALHAVVYQYGDKIPDSMREVLDQMVKECWPDEH